MILDTLITDRTAADVARAKALSQKGFAAMTAAERAEYLQPMKGAYNASDLNRVQEACEYVANRLHQYGYAVDVQKIPHQRGGTPRLPQGYTELVSIQSTGTQYIDTGYKPNSNTRLVLDAAPVNNNREEHIASVVTSSLWYTLYADSGNRFGTRWGTNTYQYFTAGHPSVGQRLTFDKNRNKTTIGEYSITQTDGTWQMPINLFLFARNSNGTANSQNTMVLYSCQIYEGNEVIRDYVPCINPQNYVGLYDLVSEEFFGNAGTGAFVAGAAVVELPEGYTQLEYIQSSGTQYIDTGIAGKGTISMRIKFNMTEVTGYSIVGYYADASTCLRLFNADSACYLDWGTASNRLVSAGAFPTGQDFEIECGNFYVKNLATGTNIVSGSPITAFTQTTHICLFGNTQYSKGKCYYLQIYDNGTIVRDFVPCKNPSNIIGLYDMANGVFYGNNGSGVFTGGAEIAPPAPPPVVDYEWIISDIPTPAEMGVYIANIQNLRDVFTLIAPQAPSDAERMTHTEANNIETILILIDDAITRMTYAFRHSGTFFANMGGLFL